MRVLRFVTLVAALLAPSLALADVSIAARAGIGGGVGSAPRPVYAGHAGVDAAIEVHRGWGIGVSYDRLVLERPDSDRGGVEEQASVWLHYRWEHRGTFGWFSAGTGLRRYRTTSDGLAVTVRGFNLLHAGSGVEWPIAPSLYLGFAFDWTVGMYRGATYDEAEALREQGIDPTPLSPGAIGGGASVYTIGPRLALVFD